MSAKNIFILDELGMGGISTNILVFSKFLNNSLICVLRKLNKSKFRSDTTSLFSPFQTLRLLINQNQSLNIFINSARGLLFFYLISTIFYFKWYRKTINVVFIVYHPAEFSGSDLFSFFYRHIIHQLGRNNVWFMNSSCYYSHSKLSKNNIFPVYLNLAIETSSSVQFDENLNLNKKNILTVARLVDFKIGYILQLINYANVNSDVNLVIVGSGPRKEDMSKLLALNKFSNIKLVPSVEYSELENFYRDCSVYVGMGTTLLEAAAFKKPSIVAITGETGNSCYGWFCNQSHYNVGEYQPNMPIFKMSDFLNSYFILDDLEKIKISESHYSHFNNFAVKPTVERLEKNLLKSQNFNVSILRRFLSTIFLLIIFFFEFIRFKITNSSRYNNFT